MRLALALLTTFCLLFQQAAVAASACFMDSAPMNALSMPDHCVGMDMAKDSPMLCKGHCAPDLAVVPDTKWPPVHYVAMLPPPLDLLFVQDLPDPGMPAITPVHRSDPPPRLRYCRLLI
ncbi:MAG: hypothetical protein ABIR27_09350 [Dokdonella sp.]